jgi:hypothetical protein
MKNQSTTINVLSGINEIQPQLSSNVTELVNWEADVMTNGWCNKIGYEMYFSYQTTFAPFAGMKPIDSIYCFVKNQGAKTLILFESAGKLYYLDEFGTTPDKVILQEDRTICKPTEAKTQYMQFGRFVLIANGYDTPLKYLGWPQVRTDFLTEQPIYTLGFHRQPETPIVWGVEVDITQKGAVGNVTANFGFNRPWARTGLGIKSDDRDAAYSYRVSFITNTGSESPVSNASQRIEWTATTPQFCYNITVELPIGEPDVIARRIYRTKNFSADGGADGNVFYFLTDVPNNIETFYIDDKQDIQLGSVMPDTTSSVLFPAPQFRFMATYKDCLFVDGGISDDGSIYFSFPTRPDQFEAANFLSVGHRQAGGITGFYGYFGFMLVFRENGIDVIQGDYPNFVATPFQNHIGTTAVDTITSVPGLGIIFLSYDGVYAVQQNLEYSDTTAVKKISLGISDTIKRMNVDVLATATAIYSAKHKEWHCYFAVDGSDKPNLGIVYHVDKTAWSIREDFPVNCITKNIEGDLIFGSTRDDSGVPGVGPAGIHVISKSRTLGQIVVLDQLGNNSPPTSIMASAWLDMGDPSIKKKVHGVYLFVATGGDNTITMDVFKDYNYNSFNTTSAIKLQRADFTDQNVYDLVLLDNDKYWEEPMITPIRFDVHNGSCSWFRWKITTTTDLTIIGYAIDYTASGTRIIAGKRLA